MRNIEEFYGKRLKAKEEVKMFRGFPGSDNIQLLPAGGLTGKIYSYLPQGPGYFQVLPDDGSPFNYVADTEAVQVVDEGAKDESGILGNLWAWTGTTLSNSGTWIRKNSGFVATGFKESVDILDSNVDKYARYALIGGGLFLAIQLIKLVRE